MASFFTLGIEDHLGKEGHLVKLSELIDWSALRVHLEDVHSTSGPTGYDVVQMFKCLLLQSWHSLSDPGLEQALRVRLDFLQFTGFELGASLPDETTFCRFRNKLVSKGKYDVLLSEVNHQLESYGLKVKEAEVAIVDATIISSNARARKVTELDDSGEPQIEHSADPDASWKKKGKKSHFGYQGFARSDDEGFIDKTHVTPANVSEMGELDVMSDGLAAGTRVNADKGFTSRSNRAMLKKKGLKSGLMYKGYRNKALTERMRAFNKLVSQTRWRIEQNFGTMKRRFNYHKASYFTTEKVAAQFTMKALCLNLLKAANKIELA